MGIHFVFGMHLSRNQHGCKAIIFVCMKVSRYSLSTDYLISKDVGIQDLSCPSCTVMRGRDICPCISSDLYKYMHVPDIDFPSPWQFCGWYQGPWMPVHNPLPESVYFRSDVCNISSASYLRLVDFTQHTTNRDWWRYASMTAVHDLDNN